MLAVPSAASWLLSCGYCFFATASLAKAKEINANLKPLRIACGRDDLRNAEFIAAAKSVGLNFEWHAPGEITEGPSGMAVSRIKRRSCS